MDVSEENRLATLLLSVEREENEVLGRPTGEFARQLFNESDEEDTNVAGSDDDEGHVHLAQELEGNDVQGHEKGGEFLRNMSDDFDELDNIPIHNSLHGDTLTKADGNILRMRVGCTVGVAKYIRHLGRHQMTLANSCKTPDTFGYRTKPIRGFEQHGPLLRGIFTKPSMFRAKNTAYGGYDQGIYQQGSSIAPPMNTGGNN
ncbi:hypothetical protein J6590_081174 [Homalodisca vitripennis]|nr:hypothetical protein J6590_081174 [Homalodisca vitripennis]